MADTIVPSTKDKATNFLKKLNERFKVLLEAIEKAFIEDDLEDWFQQLDETECMYDKTRREIKAFITSLMSVSSRGDTRQQANPSKVEPDKFLKLFILSKDHNPSKLRKWTNQVIDILLCPHNSSDVSDLGPTWA